MPTPLSLGEGTATVITPEGNPQPFPLASQIKGWMDASDDMEWLWWLHEVQLNFVPEIMVDVMWSLYTDG